MTAILRQVDKTFTFEEQRVEINEIGLDLYNLKLSQSDDIELTDFTVDTATLANSGGSLTYVIEGTAPNQVGKFTFTPADVFSGDYADLTNKPTKLSDFTDDLNYSIPSDLNDLDDVLITNATPNHYLKWDGTKWTNQVLNEIVVQKNLASTTPDLTRTVTTTGITLTYTPPDLSGFATKVTTDDSAPFNPYDGQLWWKSDEGKLKIAYQDPNSLQWVDASPAGIQLSDLDVNEKTAAATSKLEYDPATGIFDYTPTTAGSTVSDFTGATSSADGTAGLVIKPSAGDEGKYLKGDGTWATVSGSSLVVTADVPPTSPSDGELWYNSAQGKLKIYYQDVDSSQWVDTNGGGGSQAVSYSDFTGATSSADGTSGLVIKPSAGDEGKYLKGDGTWATVTSSGSGIALTDISVVKPNPAANGGGDVTYDNTTGAFTYTPPVIPAAQVQSDWDATAPSGGLGVILNKPYVPPFAEIADPANNIDSGKVLKWNGTQWAPGTDISGGGTSSAQEHDMWWLVTQSSVQIDHATADRPGYNNTPDTIGLGTAELGDFGRVTQVGFAKSGDGMTELNGVFTFPTTGQWRVKSTVFGYARETGNQAGKFASAITYTSDYSTPTNSTYNTYLGCVGAPKCSEQTAASNYAENDTYNSAVASTIGGGSLANIFDGDNSTYVDMGVGHADMCYLWLSHAPITDAVKITVGFDGHGAIGYGGGTGASQSGIAQDSATLLRVDNGQPYGANGVTGSPTEIIVEDNTTNNNPIYSGILQTLTFTEYPDVNGGGGWNRGPGNRCHVYYIKVQRLVDNVLTEITYNAPASTPTWTQVNRQWSITNNSTYPNFSEVTTEYVFNITDTSTQKVKFEVDDADICLQLDINSLRQSRFFFQKLEGGSGSSFDLTTLDVVKAVASGDGNLQYDDAGEFTYTPPLLNFSNLKDTPSTLTADKWIKVNSIGDALEFTNAPTGASTTINNNAAERVITGSNTTGELNASDKLTLASNGTLTLTGSLNVDQVNINGDAVQLTSGTSNLKIRGNGIGGSHHLTLDDHVSVVGNLELNAGVKDKDGQLGTPGQILSTTGTEVDWIDAPTGGGASVTVSTTAPTSASNGDLWWKSDEGQLKIYYTDVDSSAWVDTSGGGSASGIFAGEGAGLVPVSTLAETSKYLKSDGSWDTPQPTLDNVLTNGNTATSKSLTVGTLNDAGGNVRSLPVNTQAASYIIQTSDVGKLIKASGDITISSANALSEGDIVTIYNSTSGDINIERSSTDMYLVGDSTSQNRVLAQKGIANLICVGTNEYVLMGGGIT
jgi:hypothetical protein